MADFPQQLEKLISRFDQNIEAYQSQVYNETQVRREFIDPFFEVLGWDVANKAGYAEAYKDVIHEDAIKIGGITKAPDYCFRIGGARKFFVEAKKPAVSITEDFDPGDKAGHDKMVSLVERMLDLHKRLTTAKNPNDKTRLEREIEATDRQIDQLDYELYELTEEEIKIVEAKNGSK
jgi:predicted type IV restriction endonuclease